MLRFVYSVAGEAAKAVKLCINVLKLVLKHVSKELKLVLIISKESPIHWFSFIVVIELQFGIFIKEVFVLS